MTVAQDGQSSREFLPHFMFLQVEALIQREVSEGRTKKGEETVLGLAIVFENPNWKKWRLILIAYNEIAWMLVVESTLQAPADTLHLIFTCNVSMYLHSHTHQPAITVTQCFHLLYYFSSNFWVRHFTYLHSAPLKYHTNLTVQSEKYICNATSSPSLPRISYRDMNKIRNSTSLMIIAQVT